MVILRRLSLIAKHRLFLKCPFCHGAGGEVQGYYEREWSECYGCYDGYKDLEDCGMYWFIGRVSLLTYIRSKWSLWFGVGHQLTFRDLIKCTLGFHQWQEENQEVCEVCYKFRHSEEL